MGTLRYKALLILMIFISTPIYAKKITPSSATPKEDEILSCAIQDMRTYSMESPNKVYNKNDLAQLLEKAKDSCKERLNLHKKPNIKWNVIPPYSAEDILTTNLRLNLKSFTLYGNIPVSSCIANLKKPIISIPGPTPEMIDTSHKITEIIEFNAKNECVKDPHKEWSDTVSVCHEKCNDGSVWAIKNASEKLKSVFYTLELNSMIPSYKYYTDVIGPSGVLMKRAEESLHAENYQCTSCENAFSLSSELGDILSQEDYLKCHKNKKITICTEVSKPETTLNNDDNSDYDDDKSAKNIIRMCNYACPKHYEKVTNNKVKIENSVACKLTPNKDNCFQAISDFKNLTIDIWNYSQSLPLCPQLHKILKKAHLTAINSLEREEEGDTPQERTNNSCVITAKAEFKRAIYEEFTSLKKSNSTAPFPDECNSDQLTLNNLPPELIKYLESY